MIENDRNLPLDLRMLREQSLAVMSTAVSQDYKNRAFMTTAFGPNGIVLLDLVKDVVPDIPVFFLDTSYHFKETLNLMAHYRDAGWNIQIARSEVDQTNQPMHEISKKACCATNKVEVLDKVLADHENWLWITAISRDQTPQRAKAPLLEMLESGHGKLAPMIAWTQAEVWSYIAAQKLKYNPLHDQGYPSIGCAPCTSPVAPGEDARAGRWRGTEQIECGLHTNTGKSGRDSHVGVQIGKWKE
jgi:phosphoadenosine phosphosulfate reductase